MELCVAVAIRSAFFAISSLHSHFFARNPRCVAPMKSHLRCSLGVILRHRSKLGSMVEYHVKHPKHPKFWVCYAMGISCRQLRVEVATFAFCCIKYMGRYMTFTALFRTETKTFKWLHFMELCVAVAIRSAFFAISSLHSHFFARNPRCVAPMKSHLRCSLGVILRHRSKLGSMVEYHVKHPKHPKFWVCYAMGISCRQLRVEVATFAFCCIKYMGRYMTFTALFRTETKTFKWLHFMELCVAVAIRSAFFAISSLHSHFFARNPRCVAPMKSHLRCSLGVILRHRSKLGSMVEYHVKHPKHPKFWVCYAMGISCRQLRVEVATFAFCCIKYMGRYMTFTALFKTGTKTFKCTAVLMELCTVFIYTYTCTCTCTCSCSYNALDQCII